MKELNCKASTAPRRSTARTRLSYVEKLNIFTETQQLQACFD